MSLVGRQIGNYVAVSELGRGGMGVVYLAEHPLIGRKVAIKVLHEELAINEQMVHRLWLEAKSASQISSDHIVEVLDFGRLLLGEAAGEKRETVYLAMELLSGKSLADLFWTEGIMLRDAVDIGRQICLALAASHEQGIVHRDLKPENVHLIEREGQRNFVKILDFGIAKLVSNPHLRTRTGVLLGTPAYMSPEQCRGSGEVDFRSDIYSLGIMLYELTSGTLPFAAKGFGDVLVAQMTRRPEPPSTYNPALPKNIEALILCALEKKPEDRFQSMVAMGAALANVAAELESWSDQTRVTMTGRSEKTTQKGTAEMEETAGTLMDPPGLERGVEAPAAAQPVSDLHLRSTHLLGGGKLHVQQTLIKDDLHSRTTRLHHAQPSAAPQAATDHPTLKQPGGKPDLNQRLPGMSLKDALGSTGAVRQLEAALGKKGAAPPVAPDLTRAPPRQPATDPSRTVAPAAHDEDVFLDDQRRGVQKRMIFIGVAVVVAMIGLLFALR